MSIRLSCRHTTAELCHLADCHELVTSSREFRNQRLCRNDALLIEVMHQDDISILHLSENCVDGVLRVSRLPVQCIHGPDDGRHSRFCEDRLTGIIDLSSRRADTFRRVSACCHNGIACLI